MLLIKSKFMCLLILMYQMHSWYLDLINDNDVSISSIIWYLFVWNDAFTIQHHDHHQQNQSAMIGLWDSLCTKKRDVNVSCFQPAYIVCGVRWQIGTTNNNSIAKSRNLLNSNDYVRWLIFDSVGFTAYSTAWLEKNCG